MILGMITTKTFETVVRIPVRDRARGTAIHEPICDNPSMCRRYRLSRRKQVVDEYFGSVSDDEEESSPRYNVAPTRSAYQPDCHIKQLSQ
jgi:hypothetical protein